MADQAGSPPNNNNVNVGDLGQDVKNLSDAVRVLVEQITDLVGNHTPLGQINNDLDTMSLRLKALVDGATEYGETFKELMDIQKDFTKNSFWSRKTYGEVKQRMENFLHLQEEMVDGGMFSPRQKQALNQYTQGYKRQMADLEGSMKRMGHTFNNVMDPAVIASMQREMGRLVRQTNDYQKALSQVKLSSIERHIGLATKVTGQVPLGRFGQGINDMVKARQMAHELRNAQAEMRGQKLVEFKDKQRKVIDDLGARGLLGRRAKKLKLNLPYDEAGNLDVAALKAQRGRGRRAAFSGDEMQDVAGRLAGTRGITGKMDRILGAKILQKVQAGEELGVGGKFGAKLMGMGGGSVMGGLGESMMGKAAGAQTFGAEAMGGPIGWIAMAGKLVMDLHDKITKENAAVDSGLGGAGLYTGGENGFQALQNARTNLSPGGIPIFGQGRTTGALLGVTYEKNLEMAKALAEAGVSVSELAHGGAKGDNNYVRGTFGAIQQAGYERGRLVGEDPQTAFKQQLKLIQTYRQSARAAADFFDQQITDMKHSGVAAGKWLQTIDEVSGHFDMWNRNLEDVTTTLRVLGRTGTMSAEQIQDSMTALSGQPRSTPVRAYLAARMVQSGAINDLAGGQQYISQQQGKQVREQLVKSGFDPSIANGIDFTDPSAIHQLQIRVGREASNRPEGSLDTQAVGASLEQARTYALQYQNTRGLQRNGVRGVVGYAEMQDMLGTDFNQQAAMTQATLRDAARSNHTSLSQLLIDPSKGNTNAVAGVVEQMKTLQQDPAVTKKIMGGLTSAGIDIVNQAVKKSPFEKGGLPQGEYEVLSRLAHQNKIVDKALTGPQAVGQIKSLSQEQQQRLIGAVINSGMAMQELVRPDSPIRKALTAETVISPDERERRLHKAEQVAVFTRPMADVFKDAFSGLFNQLTRPITAIETYIASWDFSFFKTKASLQDKQSLKDMVTGVGKQGEIVQENAQTITQTVRDAQTALSGMEISAVPADGTPERAEYDKQKKTLQDYITNADASQNKMSGVADDLTDVNKAMTTQHLDQYKQDVSSFRALAVQSGSIEDLIAKLNQSGTGKTVNQTNINVTGAKQSVQVVKNAGDTGDSGEGDVGTKVPGVNDDDLN